MCTIRGHFGSAPEWLSNDKHVYTVHDIRYIIHRTTIYYITHTVLCTVYYIPRTVIYHGIFHNTVYYIPHRGNHGISYTVTWYTTYSIWHTVYHLPYMMYRKQISKRNPNVWYFQRYFLLLKNLESRLLIWPLESFNIRSSISKIWGKRLSSGEQWVPKRTELRLKILLEILYEDPLWVICNDLNVNLQGEDGSFS